MTGEVEWELEAPPEWRKKVAGWEWKEWRVQGTLLGWKKSGACPRCRHSMTAYQEELFHSEGVYVDAACNCPENHPGRPDSVDGGCGRHGLIPPYVPTEEVAEL